jgi:hypothetical protein
MLTPSVATWSRLSNYCVNRAAGRTSVATVTQVFARRRYACVNVHDR